MPIVHLRDQPSETGPPGRRSPPDRTRSYDHHHSDAAQPSAPPVRSSRYCKTRRLAWSVTCGARTPDVADAARSRCHSPGSCHRRANPAASCSPGPSAAARPRTPTAPGNMPSNLTSRPGRKGNTPQLPRPETLVSAPSGEDAEPAPAPDATTPAGLRASKRRPAQPAAAGPLPITACSSPLSNDPATWANRRPRLVKPENDHWPTWSRRHHQMTAW